MVVVFCHRVEMKNQSGAKAGSMSMMVWFDRVSRSQVQHLVNGWTGASTSIERQYKCLLALFNFALKNGWLPKNRCFDITVLNQSQPIGTS